MLTSRITRTLRASSCRSLASLASTAGSSSSAINPATVQIGRSKPSIDYREARDMMLQNDDARDSLAYCLSFANDESDFQNNFTQLFSNKMMKEQLANCDKKTQQKKVMVDNMPLPKCLEDALTMSSSSRAIVITEAKAPFRVWNVNTAWENLCGYTYIESKGKTLGSLLKGPETNTLGATALVRKLCEGEEVGTTLVNYTKSGRAFHNRLRAGPLRNAETNEITHFVGVLQEV